MVEKQYRVPIVNSQGIGFLEQLDAICKGIKINGKFEGRLSFLNKLELGVFQRTARREDIEEVIHEYMKEHECVIDSNGNGRYFLFYNSDSPPQEAATRILNDLAMTIKEKINSTQNIPVFQTQLPQIFAANDYYDLYSNS